MKLKDARDNYSYFSSKASDIVRQLGLAGIALIWVFKISVNGKQCIHPELINPACFIIASLAFDLLHYISGALSWGIYARYREKLKTNENDEFLAPREINWPGNIFFGLKIISIVIAYCYLLRFLMKMVF